MAGSKIAIGLEKLVNNSANLTGRLQVGINKVLWGNGNTQPVQTVTYSPISGSLVYNSNIPTGSQTTKGPTGLFYTLDALNRVDLCNVISYATDTISVKKSPRPEKPWTKVQETLYNLQDRAGITVTYIDKYTAYPNVFIGSYVGLGPNAQPIPQAYSQSNAPVDGGINVTKYNLYFLMKSIQEVFSFNTPGTGSLLTAEDKTILTTVPGLGPNLNIVNDFIGIVNRYADYRQIPNSDLQSLQNKVTTLRSVCVTIQNLDFRNSLALAGNFIGTDVRAQIQEVSKYISPTKILPELKSINSAIRTFIRIAQQIQGILNLGQFVIKLGLLFYKIFKFVIAFFGSLPLASLYTTAGIQTRIQDAKEKAKDESEGIIRTLKAVNALLSVIVTFMRYLLANANELAIRLDRLITTLEGCDAVKDSDVVRELQGTAIALKATQEQLAAYIIKYDTKTDPATTTYGKYEIRVLEEEVNDPTLRYKRRRGIALDEKGQLTLSTDPTFATNTQLIIEEVKQKLVAANLILPNIGTIDATNLSTISDSLTYLDINDVVDNDLNISDIDNVIEEALNEDTNSGLGLGDFINNLPGGRKLRKRVAAALSAASTNLNSQLSREKTNSATVFKNK